MRWGGPRWPVCQLSHRNMRTTAWTRKIDRGDFKSYPANFVSPFSVCNEKFIHTIFSIAQSRMTLLLDRRGLEAKRFLLHWLNLYLIGMFLSLDCVRCHLISFLDWKILLVWRFSKPSSPLPPSHSPSSIFWQLSSSVLLPSQIARHKTCFLLVVCSRIFSNDTQSYFERRQKHFAMMKTTNHSKTLWISRSSPSRR